MVKNEKAATTDDLLARLARVERKEQDAASERASIRAELDRLEAEARAEAARPRLATITEGDLPRVALYTAAATKLGYWDARRLVTAAECRDFPMLVGLGIFESDESGSIAVPRHPKAVAAQARRCLGADGASCGQMFADEASAARHWGLRHHPDRIAAEETSQRSERLGEEDTEKRRKESREREARFENWRREPAAAIAASRRVAQDSGHPIPRPDINDGPDPEAA